MRQSLTRKANTRRSSLVAFSFKCVGVSIPGPDTMQVFNGCLPVMAPKALESICRAALTPLRMD